MVCATQRSGSTVAIDDLANLAGDYPFDTEFLFGESILRRNDRSFEEIWETVCRHCHIRDFAVNKVMFHYTAHISTVMAGGVVIKKKAFYEFAPERFDAFYDFFRSSIWVYIDRADIFAQAVSLYFAEATDLWEIRPGQADRKEKTDRRVPYNRERMMQIVSRFAEERAGWRKFFEHYGIDPIRIEYNDVLSNYPSYLEPLIQAMGLEPPETLPARRLAKVGDAVNERYARTLERDIHDHPILRSILNP